MFAQTYHKGKGNIKNKVNNGYEHNERGRWTLCSWIPFILHLVLFALRLLPL